MGFRGRLGLPKGWEHREAEAAQGDNKVTIGIRFGWERVEGVWGFQKAGSPGG